MATPPKRWPLVSRPRSIQETDKDSTQESHESRNDPYGGAHKHGPACKGDFRAVIYPLSSQARSCCEAQPQEQGGSSPIVRLSQCEHSPYFSIGTEKLANVTLECLNNDAEESPQWQHPLQARIYPDPETFEVEILNYNVSPDLPLTVSSVTTGESIQLFRGDSCRLTVDDSWSLRVDDSHTFGLILRPKTALYNALLTKLSLPGRYEEFAHPAVHRFKTRSKLVRIRNDISTSGGPPRGIDWATLPMVGTSMVPAGNVASQGSTQIATSSPSLGREDVEGEILYKNDRTIVTVAGERTVRKTIRSDSLYNAAQQWQKEQRILETLSHQHVVKMIAKDSCKYTFTFEHGGKDLSSIKTELGFFNVNDDTVQWRIWRQSALALEYLHNQKNIRHGDIKPHNILLSDDHQITRICDFGHAQNTSEVWKGGGTEWYIPPEILNTGTVDRAADIWALGVTMLFVFKKICLPGMPGATRWEISKLGCKEGAEEDKKMLQWMQELRAARNMLPPKLDLLRKMLDPNPEKRITAKALSMKLNELAVEQQDLVEPTCSLIPLLRT